MEAHHAIIQQLTRSINLSIDEQRIYELIARRYLCNSVQMRNIVKAKLPKVLRAVLLWRKRVTLQTAGWKGCLAKTKMKIKSRYCRSSKGQILYCERGEVVSKNATAKTIY